MQVPYTEVTYLRRLKQLHPIDDRGFAGSAVYFMSMVTYRENIKPSWSASSYVAFLFVIRELTIAIDGSMCLPHIPQRLHQNI